MPGVLVVSPDRCPPCQQDGRHSASLHRKRKSKRGDNQKMGYESRPTSHTLVEATRDRSLRQGRDALLLRPQFILEYPLVSHTSKVLACPQPAGTPPSDAGVWRRQSAEHRFGRG